MTYIEELLAVIEMLRERETSPPSSVLADDSGWSVTWGPGFSLSRAHNPNIVLQSGNARCEFNDRHDAVASIKNLLDKAAISQ